MVDGVLGWCATVVALQQFSCVWLRFGNVLEALGGGGLP